MNNHAKVFYFGGGKLVFFQFKMQVEFFYPLENPFGLFGVDNIVVGEDKEVVHADDKPSFNNEISKQVIHESLEHSRRIHESKAHDCGFKEPLVGDKGSFPLMSIFDLDIVVTLADIELGENFSSLSLAMSSKMRERRYTSQVVCSFRKW